MAITTKERQERLAAKLAEAEAKAAKLKAEKKALDAKIAARQGAAARKAETQAKIIAGAAALALVKAGTLPAADLLGQLVERDRAKLGAFLGVVEPAPAGDVVTPSDSNGGQPVTAEKP